MARPADSKTGFVSLHISSDRSPDLVLDSMSLGFPSLVHESAVVSGFGARRVACHSANRISIININERLATAMGRSSRINIIIRVATLRHVDMFMLEMVSMLVCDKTIQPALSQVGQFVKEP